MEKNKLDILRKLYENWSNEEVTGITALPPSGSYREYYRIKSENKQALGVFNEDQKENNAFVSFSESFTREGLKVPDVLATDLKKSVYLVEDLGPLTLFDYITKERRNGRFPDNIVEIYRKVIVELINFQIKGKQCVDYDKCYPRASFDKQSMRWDLNYFKYYFLKLAKIPFDEQELENDYRSFIDFLLKTDCDYFLYRDFQSRNIMINNEDVYFIDYQGGRKGALQYDIASLLYDGKADIPNEVRLELFEFYLSELKKHVDVDAEMFRKYYYGYVFIRIMQAMGAYGFRGFYEKKQHFLKSIPYALNNLEYLLNNVEFPVDTPELKSILKKLTESSFLRNISEQNKVLTVRVNSFSFKRGIPVDKTDNGGGFVFDCRAIENPGRYEEYKKLTGLDKPVIKFLDDRKDMDIFISNVINLIDISVSTYLERNFTDLMINFGCTGGQHRSVYSAERISLYLRKKYNVNVVTRHIEQEMKRR